MRIGHGQVCLQVPLGTRLGGYAARTGVSAGTLDQLEVHAVTISAGSSRFAWVVADLPAVNTDLAEPLAGRLAGSLRTRPELIWLSATHTHSGPETGCRPGGGRTPPEWHEQVLTAGDLAACTALATEAPAELTVHTGLLNDVGGRRSGPLLQQNVPVTVLAARAHGRICGVVVVLPVHPTVLGADNLLVSADLSGTVRRAVAARLGCWAMVATGAAGDISTRPHRRNQQPDELARLAALAADQLVALTTPPGRAIALDPVPRGPAEPRRSPEATNFAPKWSAPIDHGGHFADPHRQSSMPASGRCGSARPSSTAVPEPTGPPPTNPNPNHPTDTHQPPSTTVPEPTGPPPTNPNPNHPTDTHQPPSAAEPHAPHHTMPPGQPDAPRRSPTPNPGQPPNAARPTQPRHPPPARTTGQPHQPSTATPGQPDAPHHPPITGARTWSLGLPGRRAEPTPDTTALRQQLAEARRTGNAVAIRTAETALQGAELAASARIRDPRLAISTVRLGDLSLVGFGGEPYLALETTLAAEIPGPLVLIGYTGGYLGYLPTAAAYRTGGYEVHISPVAEGAAELAVREAVRLLGVSPAGCRQSRREGPCADGEGP
ncbi:hypothetical protein ATK36_3002 [Amycolatopsis sulphurea]|uniref:Neutral/alkaline ceramidase-like enzyme n=2 Tax=Amycolatopsis sulphurea TaxID=76022 RepID=A0A2A9FAV8_9PSEU|nr:hypothetical protein ATK36_3002 [Amycolatopsis sulphurea]